MIMLLMLFHKKDSSFIERTRKKLNRVKSIGNNLSIRKELTNKGNIRSVHIHTNGFYHLSSFKGKAIEIPFKIGQLPILKDINNRAIGSIKKKKRHVRMRRFNRFELIKAKMRRKEVFTKFEMRVKRAKKTMNSRMGNMVKRSDIFFRNLLFGIKGDSKTSIIRNKAMLINNRRRGGKGMVARFA